jgi:hypothetical protein
MRLLLHISKVGLRREDFTGNCIAGIEFLGLILFPEKELGSGCRNSYQDRIEQ